MPIEPPNGPDYYWLFWVSCGWNPCVFVLTWRSKAGFLPH